MNSTQGLPVDDRTLDRLVDGELSRKEYDAVLRSLDQAPGQWRRCALAFLEAQAWQRELGNLRREAAIAIPPPAAVPRPQPAASNRWSLLLAVAASFLVAFGLGLVIRPFAPATPSGGGEQLAEQTVPPDAPIGDAPRPSAPVPAVAPPGRSPRENVTVVMDGGDGSGSHEVPVPVYDWSPQNERMLSPTPTNIPSEVRRVLQAMGCELRLKRQLIHIETSDGSPAVIPVEQVEIVPAGRRAYQ